MARRFRQHVPRPPGTLQGRTPAWSALPAARRSGVGLAQVRAALRAARERGGEPAVVPGWSAGPVGVADLSGVPGAPVDAAVLLPLFEEHGEATLVLIRRAAALERDPGHVALPGGHVEPGESPLVAALRESEEEIGLDVAGVEVLGLLPPITRPRSGQHVLPFVAALPQRPLLRANPGEVDKLLEVRLSELLAEGVAWEERWETPEDRPVCFFAVPRLGEDLVWGVTGRILWSLLELLTT